MSLVAHDVHVSLGRRPVLHGIDLSVRPGQVLAVVGPNGAGKSTLLRVLTGELCPDRGRVTLDRRDLTTWSPRALACRRAVLSQRQTLGAAFTVRQVVELGRHPHQARAHQDQAAVRRALRAVGLLDRADDLWTRLSGGEQQRVGLARALAQLDGEGASPSYLFLDEPTAALDLAWQHRTLHRARQLAQAGHGVLVVLHDLQLAATFADRVALIHAGRLRGVGAPRDVLHPDAIAAAWGVSAVWIDTPDLGAVPVVTGSPDSLPNPTRRPA